MSFVSLEELSNRWKSKNITLNSLVRYAGLGLIKVNILTPEFEELEANDGTFGDVPIPFTEEYRVLSPAVLQEHLAKNLNYIKENSPITPFGSTYTTGKMMFSDLVVDEGEIEKFGKNHFNDLEGTEIEKPIGIENTNLTIVESSGFVFFKKQKFDLTKPQIDCVKVLKEFQESENTEVVALGMLQKEILAKAKLEPNVKRLSQVFRSREEALKAIFKNHGKGRYSFNV